MDLPTSTILQERSARTLSRLCSDSTLTYLVISNEEGETIGPEIGQFWPSNRAELSRLGDAIRSNTHVENLFIGVDPENDGDVHASRHC